MTIQEKDRRKTSGARELFRASGFCETTCKKFVRGERVNLGIYKVLVDIAQVRGIAFMPRPDLELELGQQPGEVTP